MTSLERSPLLPEVPTLDELGVRGYEVNTWFGFVAPAGTPPEIVTRLNREIDAILALPDVRENLISQGFELAQPMSPSAFMTLIRDDMTKWIPIVKASRGGGELIPGSRPSPSRVTMSYAREIPMSTLTIRLDPKLQKALDRVAKNTGRTKSEIAREALRRQVAVARFRELRRKTLPFAEAQGLVTDEDVFRFIA